MATIQFRRGAESELPALAAGEPGMTTDSGRLYIGTAGGNREVAVTGADGKLPAAILPDTSDPNTVTATVQTEYN